MLVQVLVLVLVLAQVLVPVRVPNCTMFVHRIVTGSLCEHTYNCSECLVYNDIGVLVLAPVLVLVPALVLV